MTEYELGKICERNPDCGCDCMRAIKAYGNSMVMPLVKEIFIAIQKDIEHDKRRT